MRKIITSTVIALIMLVSVVTPAFAIANPDDISFGENDRYQVFYNVVETGDMMFVAEAFPYYAVEPTDYSASEAFIFEVLADDGVTTLLTISLNEYGDRPISIYQTPAQVTAKGLATGTAYVFRISGSPLVFPSMVGNSVWHTIDTVNDYTNMANATDTLNPLRNFLIEMAEDIQVSDGVTTYITTVEGQRYLTFAGANIFLEGIPGLDAICPILFQYSTNPMTDNEPTSTAGAYAAELTPENKWGARVARGLSQLGEFMGINQQLAGSVVLFILVILLAGYTYSRTQSGITVTLMVAATPFFGAYLGLMPMALAFILVIFIVVLMGYFFFSRGAL